MPFSAFFPAGRADVRLIDRLTSQANLQGLLRMAVGGLQQVMRRGAFSMSATVTDATQRFKMEADPMRGFIEERIKLTNRQTFSARTDIYTAYSTWAAMNGFHQMSAQRFYESFLAAASDGADFPVKSITLHGTRGFRGIELQ